MRIIVVDGGAERGLQFTGRAVTVGRSADNDIQIEGPMVSRHHCRIERGPEGVWIHDLGSSNGTLVNGERIERRLISARDELQVGRALLTVELDGPAAGSGETVAAFETGAGLATLTGEASRERENLRVFARITRELLRETDLKRLLRLIVDSAVALVGGERGFLILAEAGGSSPRGVGDLEVRIARNFDHSDIPLPASRLSMGIAGRVLEQGQAVLSVDAGRDVRFDGMASVEDLRLRSVMCLPVFAPSPGLGTGPGAGPEQGRARGVLFVDNRLQEGAFDESDLDLVRMLADQASIAIQNARLMAELYERSERLERSGKKIELLNEQLGRKVRDRDTELSVVRR